MVQSTKTAGNKNEVEGGCNVRELKDSLTLNSALLTDIYRYIDPTYNSLFNDIKSLNCNPFVSKHTVMYIVMVHTTIYVPLNNLKGPKG